MSYLISGIMNTINMLYSVIPTWRRNKYLMPNICYCNSSTDCYTGLVTTKRKKEEFDFLFLSWKEFLFFLSSSSSTRHIIYHYEINDKFCANLSKSFLRFVKFYHILRHVYYFRWIIIQLNISMCLIFIFAQ